MQQVTPQSKQGQTLTPYLSPLAVWALAFGCSVGWGAFVMPGTTFLPIAGPLGSVIGLLIGALFMAVISYNYFQMMRRYPNPGGAFAYTKSILGGDHGFLCAWMMLLTYSAIFWANATALSIFVRYLFGEVLCFGFTYEVLGYTVYFGEVLASVALIGVNCLICALCKTVAKWIQTICAMVLFFGIAACFVMVVIHHGGFSGLVPLFQRDASPAIQILGIVILAPWAYIGFENVSHSVGEFRFSKKKGFWILIAALAAGFLAYSMLSVCAAMGLACLRKRYHPSADLL